MRVLPLLAALSLFVFQAHAQTTAPPATDTAKPTAAAASQHRMGWKQRFEAANSTHDGHLTMDQAKAGYVTAARHFSEIDAAKKGYLTKDDIAAWHKLHRAARAASPAASTDPLKPRPAFHRTPLNSSGAEVPSDQQPKPQPDGAPSAAAAAGRSGS